MAVKTLISKSRISEYLAAILSLFLVAGTASAQGATAAGAYRIADAVHYQNLSVFLIHGKDEAEHKNVLTLQEAMAKNILRVHETSEVNELAVENTSAEYEVFIQSGDIV
jgi:hypothetical protein